MMKQIKISNKVEWGIRLVVAVIILQTLRFKFFAAEESVMLFSQVSEFLFGSPQYEAALRLTTGTIELVAGVLLLVSKTAFLGALLTAGTMFGAIKTHLFIIGISFNEDGGLLFIVGILAFMGSLLIMLNRLKYTPIVYQRVEKWLPQSLRKTQ